MVTGVLPGIRKQGLHPPNARVQNTRMKQLIAVIFGFLFAASVLPAAELGTGIVEIRLASDPAKAIYAAKGKEVEVSSNHASKFRLGPGLTDPQLMCFELVGAKKHYLRHRGFVLHLDENVKLNLLFNADSSFKVIHLDGDKVRFEASNYRDKFLAVIPAGGVVLIANPSPEQSTFVLKK